MTLVHVDLDLIQPNPWQTRQAVNTEYIADLAEDIRQHGLLQHPMGRLIREDGKPVEDLAGFEAFSRKEKGFRVQLAFGHSRLAAFKLLSATETFFNAMPVELKTIGDIEMADIAWSENEQRRDTTPMDRARAIQKRIESFGWTHEQVAEHLRISRSAVTNCLRLFKLPEAQQEHLHKGDISERQALALVSLYGLPEPLRQRAEAGEDISRRPSTIIEGAFEGWSSDWLFGKITGLIEAYAIDLKIAAWSEDYGFLDIAEQVRAVRCSGCEFRVQRDGRSLCGDSACFQAKTVAWMGRAPEAPVTMPAAPVEPVVEELVEIEVEEEMVEAEEIDEAPSEKAAPAPAQRPATAAPQKVKATVQEPVKSVLADDPYEYSRAQISATITWLPDDGNEHGRAVVIGVRSHQDMPAIRMYREDDFLPSEPLAGMLEELRARMAQKSLEKRE